jgi:hypothetical protein
MLKGKWTVFTWNYVLIEYILRQSKRGTALPVHVCMGGARNDYLNHLIPHLYRSFLQRLISTHEEEVVVSESHIHIYGLNARRQSIIVGKNQDYTRDLVRRVHDKFHGTDVIRVEPGVG